MSRVKRRYCQYPSNTEWWLVCQLKHEWMQLIMSCFIFLRLKHRQVWLIINTPEKLLKEAALDLFVCGIPKELVWWEWGRMHSFQKRFWRHKHNGIYLKKKKTLKTQHSTNGKHLLENKMYMYFISTFLNALLNLINFHIKTEQILFSALKTSVHTCFILHWLFTDKAFTSQTSLSSQLSKLNVFQVVMDTYSM